MAEATDTQPQHISVLVIDLKAGERVFPEIADVQLNELASLVSRSIESLRLTARRNWNFLGVRVELPPGLTQWPKELHDLLDEALNDIAAGNSTGDANHASMPYEVHCFAGSALDSIRKDVSRLVNPEHSESTASIRQGTGTNTAQVRSGSPLRDTSDTDNSPLDMQRGIIPSKPALAAPSIPATPPSIPKSRTTHGSDTTNEQPDIGLGTVDSLEIQSRQQHIETLAERIRVLELELLNEQRVRVALEEIVHKTAQSPDDLSARITNIVQGVRHGFPVYPGGEQQLLGVTNADDAMTLINTLSLEVLTPLIRKEINDLLAEHGITVGFDAWLLELCDEEEVLISNVPLIDVISRLTTLGSQGGAAVCIAATNTILDALGGKKIPKQFAVELVQAIQTFGAEVKISLRKDAIPVSTSPNVNDQRYKHAWFSSRQIGSSRSGRKTWSDTKFPRFLFS